MKVFRAYRKREKAAAAVIVLITAASFIYLCRMYPGLPDTVPIHFGLWGEPDGWGDKNQLFVFGGIQILIAAASEWALYTSVKESIKTGFTGLKNRDSCYLSGVFVSAAFGWLSFATIRWGRIGKYFVFILLGFVAALLIYIYLRKEKQPVCLKEERAEKARKTESGNRDDTSYEAEGGDMRFRGKIAVWMWGFLIFMQMVVLGVMVSLFLREGFSAEFIVTALLLGLLDAFLVPMYFRNDVILKREELLIRFGFISKGIRYLDITHLQETHNPLSSLAMSLDRIYIYTLSGNDVMISVRDKQQFIDEVYKRIQNQ